MSTVAIESYWRNINALSDTIIPVDPNPVELEDGSFVPDVATSSLQRVLSVSPSMIEPFWRQVVRYIKLPEEDARRAHRTLVTGVDLGFEVDITTEEAIVFMEQLDLQAVALGSPTYWQLSAANQLLVFRGLQNGTLPILPATAPPLTTAGFVVLAAMIRACVKGAYWLNFPWHRVRKADIGIDFADPNFTQNPVDQITSPNDRMAVTGFTYRKWSGPYRIGVETRLKSAFRNANSANAGIRAVSDVDFSTMFAAAAAKTMWKQN